MNELHKWAWGFLGQELCSELDPIEGRPPLDWNLAGQVIEKMTKEKYQISITCTSKGAYVMIYNPSGGYGSEIGYKAPCYEAIIAAAKEATE